jgi:hypothetical protein
MHKEWELESENKSEIASSPGLLISLGTRLSQRVHTHPLILLAGMSHVAGAIIIVTINGILLICDRPYNESQSQTPSLRLRHRHAALYVYALHWRPFTTFTITMHHAATGGMVKSFIIILYVTDLTCLQDDITPYYMQCMNRLNIAPYPQAINLTTTMVLNDVK